ncbi:hypothetical protein E2C01_023861 [Portunus trituberculatus]|uniref:Uncharacterized protein n=1 Tax=Portunus trituberculatus TaxID=210409 RepID=A0A5B7ECT2_PORTR|nr:hypothetical protein [Portunus trituberculatus]
MQEKERGRGDEGQSRKPGMQDNTVAHGHRGTRGHEDTRQEAPAEEKAVVFCGRRGTAEEEEEEEE